MFDRDLLNTLYRYCFTLTGDEHEGYDLLQASLEKFLKIDVSSITNKLAYMRQIIRNQYIDNCRKSSKIDQIQFDDTVTHVDMDISSLETIVANQHQVELIWQKLTSTEREIMYFWAIEGYTTSELSEILGISRGTLLSRIHRLRKRLELEFDDSCREDAG